MKKTVLALLAIAALPLAVHTEPPPPPAKVDYVRDVKPILAQYCYGCHGEDAQQAGLRLDLRQNALRGGDYGPVIVPGKSAESKLIRRIVDGDGGMQMPPTGPLSAEDIGVLRAWIDQGAEFRTDLIETAPARAIDPRLADLVRAVRSEPRLTVAGLLQRSPDLVASPDLAGSTLLHHAAAFGTLDTMALLIEQGAEVNAKNRRKSTPLHWAIHDIAKVRLLLTHGATVNARQIDGRTPLFLAASLGDGNAVLRLLLARGADPAIATANGQTPLMAAALRGDVEALGLLIASEADVNARNGAGETALMFAATSGNADAVRLLLEQGADARVRSKRNETALGNAGTAGVEEAVRLLLDHGAEVNVRNIRGYSPLMLAASSDAIPSGVVKLLLAKGADTSGTADYDESARDLAAKRGDTAVTRLLGGTVQRASERPGTASFETIPQAVEKALGLLESQSHNFIRIAGCNSCHSQDLPSAAAAFARSRGLRAPREIPRLPEPMTAAPERLIDFNVVAIIGPIWELFERGMNGLPANAYTDAAVRLIVAAQTPDGHWSVNESRRPPMAAGDYQATALAIYALKHYGRAIDRTRIDQAIARASAWLERANPETTQDRAFQALGLAWSDAGAETVRRTIRALAAMQRSDGGWSQLATLDSDAYASGQALYALAVAGRLSPADLTYKKGIEYLLRTQAPDGSWHVRSRSIWLQPYFESGFPYGRDQFISTAGTAWASMALVATVQPVPSTR